MIGLGRMGANIASRLLRGGHECVVFGRNPTAVKALPKEGAIGTSSLDEFAVALTPPRAVWLMAPAAASRARHRQLRSARDLPRAWFYRYPTSRKNRYVVLIILFLPIVR